MNSEKIQVCKEEIALLKQDIDILNNMIKYVEENINGVDPDTIESFQQNVDKFVDNLKVVVLW